jgi:hypothetical protein
MSLMANVISLNTSDHPTLTQVLVWTTTGLFDFKAQQAAGSITVSNAAAKAALLSVKNPTTGKTYLKET